MIEPAPQARNIARTILAAPPRLADSRLVTIDGPSGAGKTQLARAIQEELSGLTRGSGLTTGEPALRPALADLPIVVHTISLDDLYQGWRGLVPDLWHRIHDDILSPLAQRRTARYQTYDWEAERFLESKDLEPPDVLILEGVGAGHPITRDRAEPRIWLEVDDAAALARAKARDQGRLDAELNTWLQDQRAYFERFRPNHHATLTLLS